MDIAKHPILEKRWSFNKKANPDYANGVLLTGANSFIGTFILCELTKMWPGKIHCLLRAESTDNAYVKLHDAQKTWQPGSIDFSKIEVHVGECTKPGWGIPIDEYLYIQKNITNVIHAALLPKYDLPFEYYNDVWIPDFANMIDYCGDSRYPKFFHYPGSYNSHFFTTQENFARLNTDAWHSGYSGFKWIVEKVMLKAIDSGLLGCLYDIPLVFGSLNTGLCPPQYAFFKIITLFLKTGIGVDCNFKIITVDCLAKIIVNNVLSTLNNKMLSYVRPVLDRKIYVDEIIKIFKNDVIRLGTYEEFMCAAKKYQSIAKYLLPYDFGNLIAHAHESGATLPPEFDATCFPDALEALAANCSYWRRVHYN